MQSYALPWLCVDLHHLFFCILRGAVRIVVYGEEFEHVLVSSCAMRNACKAQRYDCESSKCVAWPGVGSRLMVEGIFYGGSPQVLFRITGPSHGRNSKHTGIMHHSICMAYCSDSSCSSFMTFSRLPQLPCNGLVVFNTMLGRKIWRWVCATLIALDESHLNYRTSYS